MRRKNVIQPGQASCQATFRPLRRRDTVSEKTKHRTEERVHARNDTTSRRHNVSRVISLHSLLTPDARLLQKKEAEKKQGRKPPRPITQLFRTTRKRQITHKSTRTRARTRTSCPCIGSGGACWCWRRRRLFSRRTRPPR